MITHKVNDTLPHGIDHEAEYLVNRDDGLVHVVDRYHSSKLPTPGGSINLNSPVTNPSAIGTVGVDAEKGDILLESDPAADNTKGTYVAFPLSMSGSNVAWSIRFKRSTSGVWPSDDHTDGQFIISISSVSAGSLSYRTDAGGYQQIDSDNTLSIHFAKNDLASVLVKKRDAGVETALAVTHHHDMSAYDGESYIDIIVTKDATKAKIEIICSGGDCFELTDATTSIPYFTTGSVNFHLHSLGETSSEFLSELSVYKTDVRPVLYREDASNLASLI